MAIYVKLPGSGALLNTIELECMSGGVGATVRVTRVLVAHAGPAQDPATTKVSSLRSP